MTVPDCLFCQVAAGDIPATLVHADEGIVAFRDINPQAPVHVLVIPRKHLSSLDDADAGDEATLGRMLLVAGEIARREGIAEPGYRAVLNVGADGGQSVQHLHVHVLGGRAMGWPPG